MQQIFSRIIAEINESSLGNSNVGRADATRVFHGRGHCYEGLEFVTLDWFEPLLLVTFYKAPEEEWLATFKECFSRFFDTDKKSAECIDVVVFQYRYLPGAPCEFLKGELADQVLAHEGALDFNLTIGRNQNIGFFLDMKNCRQWLSKNAENKSILNLFSYTCAFSVVAANAGAKMVVNMDMAKGALSTGKKNHKINNINTDSVFFFSHDIFRSWGKIRKYGPYDCIIVDPPSFQRGSFDARKDYKRIVDKLSGLLTADGLVMASLNSPELDFAFLRGLFEDAGGYDEVQVIPTPDTFPEIDKDKGLKTIVFKKK